MKKRLHFSPCWHSSLLPPRSALPVWPERRKGQKEGEKEGREGGRDGGGRWSWGRGSGSPRPGGSPWASPGGFERSPASPPAESTAGDADVQLGADGGAGDQLVGDPHTRHKRGKLTPGNPLWRRRRRSTSLHSGKEGGREKGNCGYLAVQRKNSLILALEWNITTPSFPSTWQRMSEKVLSKNPKIEIPNNYLYFDFYNERTLKR